MLTKLADAVTRTSVRSTLMLSISRIQSVPFKKIDTADLSADHRVSIKSTPHPAAWRITVTRNQKKGTS